MVNEISLNRAQLAAITSDPDALRKLEDLFRIAGESTPEALEAHKGDANNPHEVTAEQVGTYSKAVIDGKDTAVQANLDTHTANTSNPHGVTHAQVTGKTPNDHHNQVHALFGADHSDVDTSGSATVGSGLIWTGTKFERLVTWAASGYGGIRRLSSTALPDLGAGWVTLTAAANWLTTPRNVTQDTSTDSISLDVEGVWNVSISFCLAHDESASARSTRLRLYNINAAAGGAEIQVPLGTNSNATTYAVTFPLEITSSTVGNAFRVELGNGSTATSVAMRSFSFSANLVSEYRG